MTDYADIGLGLNLIKELPKIYDVDLAIDDESIWGIKLAKKSVALDRLYGDNLQIGGTSNISGYVSIYDAAMAKISQIDDTGYHGYDSDGTERVTLDSTYGIKVVDDASNNVLKAYIDGVNVGDVQIGTYDPSAGTGAGAYYDKDTSTFYVSGSIAATELRIGTQPLWFRVDSSGNMWSGSLNLPTAITNTFAVTNAGVLYAQSANVSGTITSGTGSSYTGNQIAETYIGNLNCNKITAGSFVVGGTNQPSAITIKQSTLGGNARLAWEGGSRMWEDSGSNIGINAIGGQMYFYTGSTQRVFIGSSNINFYPNVVYLHGINFSFDGQTEGSIYNVDEIKGANDIRITGNGDVRFYRDNSYNPGVRFEWGTGKIFSYSSTINLGGTDKSAIVPTSDGYKALYCAEAPEVWFFDFCDTKESIDPMFLEVTEGDMKFTKLDDGTYQVWRRRKGHAEPEKRFAPKTAEEFKKNNEFWSTPFRSN